MKRIICCAAALTVFLWMTGSGFCQDDAVNASDWTKIVEQKTKDQVAEASPDGKGLINYEDGYIDTIGIGAPPEKYYGKPQARPMALQAAQVDAYRNLLEIVKGVQIDSQTIVKDFVMDSDVIKASVSGLVKGAKVVKKTYLSDGTVEVTVRMGLGASFNKVILTKAIADDKKDDKAIASPKVPVKPAKDPDQVFTGLVIDARELTEARPAMSPKILDENGKEVYGTLIVNKGYAIQQGISGYAKNLEVAQANPRVTDRPIIVKGLRTEGAGNSDIVISNDDAKQLRAIKENLTFMQKCRVMIVLH